MWNDGSERHERAWYWARVGIMGIGAGLAIGGAVIAVEAGELRSIEGILRGMVYVILGGALAWLAARTE